MPIYFFKTYFSFFTVQQIIVNQYECIPNIRGIGANNPQYTMYMYVMIHVYVINFVPINVLRAQK